jgi:hemoglobin/transferrin/lactoferrin receptor protein
MSAYYFCIQYQNVERARLYGVELEATYDAVGWFATISGQHIESENVGTGERLTSAPPDQVALTFGKRFLDGKLTIAPRWQHVWGVTDPSAGTYKPFDLVGLTIAYKPSEDVTAALVVDNLLDAYYVPYLQNLPAPGISAKASLTVRFGGGSRPGG